MTAHRSRSRLAVAGVAALLIASTLAVGAAPLDGRFGPASVAAQAAPGPAAPGPAAPEQAAEPWIDVDNLDPVPERMWGVSGLDVDATQTSTLDVLVWDMVQIGDRMFVGGGFLDVQENKDATPIDQSFIAAFDVRTGDWIDTWRPTVDRVVYALAEHDGRLLVGGEFEQVNGQARTGLVALDPLTGATDGTFAGFVERPWSNLRAMVRDIEVRGDNIYVVGNFSHLNGAGGVRTRVYKAGRLTGATGEVDTSWKPEVTGSGVWAIDTNPTQSEASLTGFFSAVNGEANTGNFHTVNTTDGATVGGKIELPRNYPQAQPEMFDVAYGSGNVFVSGEQHVVQVLQEGDQQMLGYHTTGVINNGFEYTGGFAGGAFQSAEQIGEWIVAGCHCTYSTRNGKINHYSSFTGQRSTHRLFMVYDAATGRLHEPFEADVHSPRDGTWTATGDTYGCLWVGGDFHVGGVDHGTSRWLGGMARFCPTDLDPNAPPPEPEPEPDPNVLVEAGADWWYQDDGADLGTSWRSPNYNQVGWPSGSAEFGFGEADEVTAWSPGHLTYYAIHHFDFTGAQPESLSISLKADDGAVVYLNGVELVRDNLGDGLITADTPASTWKGTEDEVFVDYTVPATALVEGTNVVAVEIHNVWANNGDLSFDLRMSRSEDPAPVVNGPLVARGSEWAHRDVDGPPPADWTTGMAEAPGLAPFGFGEDYIATAVTAGRESYYFTRTFPVDDPAALDDLTLSLLADDGAVVYLNGVEIHRFNMPAGEILWDTRPLNWVAGADETYVDTVIGAGSLVAGDNVIAVEVHNYWPGNSDLSFDLSLE